jgi:predicted CXXCH cytochrome family protein
MIRILQHMKQRKPHCFHFLFILLLIGCSIAVSSFSGHQDVSAEQAPAQLTTADCIKCHTAVVQTVDSKGAKHKTAVSCMDCHKGHPPMVSKEKIIPLCSACHAGKKHYEIGGCNACHSDPHAPVDMKLGANITGPCLSCHEQQGKEVKDHPTLHSKLFCTTCHKEHKQVPPCLQCHRAHTSEMVNKDCLTCHPAHQPLSITYGPDMSSNFCAPCHQKIANTLTGTTTKHSKLACVFCHKEKHKMVPACESCHGSPHPASMTAKFKNCNACHISAHSLGEEVKK